MAVRFLIPSAPSIDCYVLYICGSFPAGYLTLAEVFKYGALCGTINLLLWAATGSVWWKLLGLF